MVDLTPEERALLGLGTDDTLELKEDIPFSSSVGSALANSSLQQLEEKIRDQPHFDSVFDGTGLGDVRSWAGTTGIFVVPLLAEVATGAHALFEDTQVIDARKQAALVRVDVDGDHFVIRLDGSSGQLFQSSPRSRLTTLTVTAPESVTVPAPSLASLLGDEACAEWLHQTFSELTSSPDGPSRFAAVGLMVRAWTPVDSDARQRAIERNLAGEATLVDRTRAWVAGVSEAVLSTVTRQALDDARDLASRPETLRAAFLSDDSLAESISVGIIVARDDLASVRTALALVDRGEELEQELRVTDEIIAIHMTPLMTCAPAIRAALNERMNALRRYDDDESWWLAW